MSNLGLYVTTVIGYLSVLVFSMMMFIHFLRVGLNSKTSVTIDPKPENTFTDNN